jgi:CHRD domain
VYFLYREEIMKKLGLFVLSLIVAFVLAACAPAADSMAHNDAMAGEDAMAEKDAMAGDAMMEASYTATLAGAAEVPPVETAATGSATIAVKGLEMTLTGTYEGLSGAAQAAHIHGPAAEGVNAGVAFPLTFTEGATAGSGTLSGAATLNEAQLAELTAGQWYVNVHTEANGGGEIRGQLK